MVGLILGDRVIRKVAEDMLLVVPEGTHKVTVSHKGSSATQEITFARNEEMAWDLGEVEITVVQKNCDFYTDAIDSESFNRRQGS